jgi:hypothetical protein
MMAEGEEKKGFTIRDRRFSAQGAESSKAKEEKGKAESTVESGKEREERRGDSSPPLPEINFSSFIFSLSTSALMHLGEIPDPLTQERRKDLPLAKQTIDILGILEEKTKGNLAADEENLIRNILADLRWRYVREVEKK